MSEYDPARGATNAISHREIQKLGEASTWVVEVNGRVLLMMPREHDAAKIVGVLRQAMTDLALAAWEAGIEEQSELETRKVAALEAIADAQTILAWRSSTGMAGGEVLQRVRDRLGRKG